MKGTRNTQLNNWGQVVEPPYNTAINIFAQSQYGLLFPMDQVSQVLMDPFCNSATGLQEFADLENKNAVQDARETLSFLFGIEPLQKSPHLFDQVLFSYISTVVHFYMKDEDAAAFFLSCFTNPVLY